MSDWHWAEFLIGVAVSWAPAIIILIVFLVKSYRLNQEEMINKILDEIEEDPLDKIEKRPLKMFITKQE